MWFKKKKRSGLDRFVTYREYMRLADAVANVDDRVDEIILERGGWIKTKTYEGVGAYWLPPSGSESQLEMHTQQAMAVVRRHDRKSNA